MGQNYENLRVRSSAEQLRLVLAIPSRGVYGMPALRPAACWSLIRQEATFMRRLLVLSVLLTMIAGLVVPDQTLAQGTPTATGPGIGEPSPLFSQAGREVGTIAA